MSLNSPTNDQAQAAAAQNHAAGHSPSDALAAYEEKCAREKADSDRAKSIASAARLIGAGLILAGCVGQLIVNLMK